MLSLRLMQKLGGLNDEALAHFEAQADLLLTLPACCRAGVYRRPLHLVEPPAIVAASLVASKAASTAARRRSAAEAQTWLTRSRRLLATLQATTAAKPQPAKVDRRRFAIVKRARSG